MRRIFLRATCVALVGCALVTAGTSFGAEGEPAAPAKAPAASHAAQPFMQPITLTDDKMKGFLDAMDEIKALGEEGSKFSATNPSLVRGMEFSEETTGIIKKHGFSDTAEFKRVAYNTATAYYVVQNGGKEGLKKKMAQADVKRAEAMEKLKKHLTADQLKLLEAQMDSGTATMRAMVEQPDQNLDLVKKYSDRMGGMGKR